MSLNLVYLIVFRGPCELCHTQTQLIVLFIALDSRNSFAMLVCFLHARNRDGESNQLVIDRMCLLSYLMLRCLLQRQL